MDAWIWIQTCWSKVLQSTVDSYPSDIIVLEFSPAGKGGTYRSFSEPWVHRRQKTSKKNMAMWATIIPYYTWASTCRTERCSDGQWEWAKLALQLLATIDVTMWHSREPWTFQWRHTNIASGNWPCSLINIHRSMMQTYSTGLRSLSSVLRTKAATDCVKLQW